MKRILLLTDFSINATNAITYALAHFTQQDCQYVVLNIQKSGDFNTDDLITATAGTSIYDSIIADNQLALDNYISELKTTYAPQQLNVKGIVDYDVFTDAVNQVVLQHNIDLLVMGTNGATGAKEVLFGSNTLQVIRQVTCPLLVVPVGFEFKKIQRVLYTQTQSRNFSSNDFTPLLNFIAPTTPQIALLGIHSKDHLLQLDEELQHLKNTVFQSFNTKIASLDGLDSKTAIDAYQQLNPVDLHVFFAQHESVFYRLLFGSKTSQISQKSRVPLLILNQL